MIDLHASYVGDHFFLWGESPNGQAGKEENKVVGKKKSARFRPYPHDAGVDLLVSTLREAVGTLKTRKKRVQQLWAWLPTIKDQVAPSSPMVANPPRSRAKPKLKPFTLTAYWLNIDETIELLCACVHRSTLSRGVIIGADLAFWSEALRYAGSLVARQQFLPSIVKVNGQFLGQWEPTFSGEESERPATLAQKMPPVARAIDTQESADPPKTQAAQNLRQFLCVAVDHMVRSTTADTPACKSRKKRLSFDSVHDAWVHALRSTDKVIHGDESALEQLWEQVHEWSRPIRITDSSPFRLCFRLEEPNEDIGIPKKRSKAPVNTWYVRYLLQPRNDPSLLVPVEQVKNMKGMKKSFLQANGSEVREYLLSSLGQASGICPRIEASLKTARPAGYTLDAAGAYEFLHHKALLLRQSGFTVMLPSWWTRKGTKLRLSMRAKVKSSGMQGKGRLSLGEIVEFNWEVAIGGEKLTLRELEALAKMKSPLVRLRGQWVEMSPDEIQVAIDFWKNKGAEKVSARSIVQMALGAKEAPHGFQFDGVKATGWVGKLLKQLGGKTPLAELPTPERFSGALRPYQLRGFSWLSFLSQWGLGACLADDMGLGKTVQTLALIQHYWNSNGRRTVLLICPTTILNNWQKEAARFTPDLPVMVQHGVGRIKGAAFKKQAQKHAMVISSYGLLFRDAKLLQDVSWAGIILDEAQNIKNAETKQAKAAKSLKADCRIALTGTPVENNVGDLWSLMEFLNPGFLGTKAEFKQKYFVPIQAERDVYAFERLKKVTGPFILRRLKTDKSIISDLPDKMEMKDFCSLTKEQASLYAAVVKDTEKALRRSDGIQRKGLILATLSKLKQVCNHPAQFLGDNSAIPGRSGKLTRLTEMMEEILQVEDRALIFSQFSEMGKLLHRYLQETFGQEVLFLHGGVSKRQRDYMIDRFQSGKKGPSIFILSLKAGGTGLNLTSANHVFHFDRWWNPAVENQATDRAFRIGQTRNVQVHKFVCAGTLEEKIDEIIEEKQEVAENVVGTGEGWITELSNNDLKEIWKLRKEALGD